MDDDFAPEYIEIEKRQFQAIATPTRPHGAEVNTTVASPSDLPIDQSRNSRDQTPQQELITSANSRPLIRPIILTSIANGGECHVIQESCDEIKIFGTGFVREDMESTTGNLSLSCLVGDPEVGRILTLHKQHVI